MPGSEGVSEPSYSSLSELRVMGDSPSSSELLDSLSSSSALRFVHSSSLRCCSWLTDPGVESVAGFGPVPVGVVRASGPPAAQSRRFAISSVFSIEIDSYNRGSDLVTGGVTKLAVWAGVVLGPAPGVPICSGWPSVGLRMLRSSLRVFSIFLL